MSESSSDGGGIRVPHGGTSSGGPRSGLISTSSGGPGGIRVPTGGTTPGGSDSTPGSVYPGSAGSSDWAEPDIATAKPITRSATSPNTKAFFILFHLLLEMILNIVMSPVSLELLIYRELKMGEF